MRLTTKLESRDDEVLLALDKANGNIEHAAQTLDVAHATLWRFLSASYPEKLTKRRPKMDAQDVHDDVCVVIYQDAVLKKLNKHVLQDKYNFSERVLRKCIQRGRTLHDRISQSRANRRS